MNKQIKLLLIMMLLISSAGYAQRFKGGSSSRPTEIKSAATEKPVEEKNRTKTVSGSVSSYAKPVPALGAASSGQLAAAIRRDLYSKPLAPGKSASTTSITAKGNLNRENSGQLALHKFKQPESLNPANLRPDNYSLYLPNKGSPQPNWRQNSGRLRAAMKLNKPITDSYRDPKGNLLPTQGFLKAERAALQAKNWKYDPNSGAWLPPSQ